MNYLDASEFEVYGLEETTDQSLVTAASALMDAHCRRETLGVAEYTERFRLNGRAVVRLTYLPLATVEGAVSALTSVKVRYGNPRRGEIGDLAGDYANAFGLAGQWASLGAEMLDYDAATGEVCLPAHPLGLGFNEVEVTYTAGVPEVPRALKAACAQIVRNCQSTPSLNVKSSTVDKMHMEYFTGSLLDEGVRKLLSPYVAQKVA